MENEQTPTPAPIEDAVEIVKQEVDVDPTIVAQSLKAVGEIMSAAAAHTESVVKMAVDAANGAKPAESEAKTEKAEPKTEESEAKTEKPEAKPDEAKTEKAEAKPEAKSDEAKTEKAEAKPEAKSDEAKTEKAKRLTPSRKAELEKARDAINSVLDADTSTADTKKSEDPAPAASADVAVIVKSVVEALKPTIEEATKGVVALGERVDAVEKARPLQSADEGSESEAETKKSVSKFAGVIRS